MTEISLIASWLSRRAHDELEATNADLEIVVDDTTVTSFISETEHASESVRLPAYYLAEWIAENWWALLWEPRKSEDGTEDDSDFLLRHSILSAQHGFYLPQLLFVSNGSYINISAIPRNVQFSDVRFTNRSIGFTKREIVEKALSSFLRETVSRLEEFDINGTGLQKHWEAIQATDKETESYCQMVGALGLSPYAENEDIEDILINTVEHLGHSYALDLCLVSHADHLKSTAHTAKLAVAALKSSSEVKLEPISSLPVPPDNLRTRAWLRGKQAASAIRQKFGVSDTDPKSSLAVFSALEIDTSKKALIGEKDFQPEGAAIVGAMRRDGNVAKISCIQRHEEQRRFTAARGLFSAWASPLNSGHLLTQAVTRHQQASRAFAAELLAPLAYIKMWQSRGAITFDDITEIAQDLFVSPDVVHKQAVNNGLAVQRF